MKLQDVKSSLNCRVHRNSPSGYGTADYIFTGCTIRRNNNGFFYDAELQDLNNSRSITICRLEEIELIP